ncbi:MAG: TonB-dependent siderophore receptor [Methylocella sp.]
MARSYSQSASALALAIAFISLDPQPGNAQTADPPPAPAEAAGGAITLPTVEVTATQEGAGAAGGGEGVNAPNQGYSAPPIQQSTTKIDVPTFDLPVAVATVPEQVIQDQNAFNIEDALQNVSGVRSYNNTQADQTNNIRGFDTFNTFRDGLLIKGTVVSVAIDTANLQRIDVLKGPASFLFGRADPGGIINLVTKKPLDAPYYSVEQQAGSFNLLRTVWDLTGPVQVLDDGAVSYRFSGSYTKGGQFIDFINNRNVFLAPAVTWKIDPATTLTIDAEYQNRDRHRFAGIPAIGMYPASLPVYRSFEEPNAPPFATRDSLIAEEFNHHFDNNWAVTSRFLAVRGSLEVTDLNATDFPNPPILVRPILFQKETSTNYSTNLDLTGKFDVLGAKNDVLIGADYYYGFQSLVVSQSGSFPINIFNPVYGTVPTSAFQAERFRAFAGQADFAFFSLHAEKDLGMYVQDVITPFEGLHVLLGTRYDLADVRDGFTATDFSTFPPIQPSFGQASANFGRNPVQHSQIPSPRFGLTYQPVPWIGFYGSHSRSFGEPNGISGTNTPFPPQKAEGWEGGVKTELLDRRLAATLAFFDITKSNVLTTTPTAANPFAMSPIGLARSQGAELDVLGKLTDELSVIASYAHIDARIIKDNSGLLGHSLHVYAPDSGSLFLTYDFAPGSELQGWRAGGGVFAASNRWGDDQNTFILPAYARLDAFARYQTVIGPTRVSAQINVYNITNTKYYSGVSFFGTPRTEIFPGAPRSIIASLRVEY